MRLTRYLSALLVVAVLLAAAPAFSADRDIAFETITLKNITAGEIAPLFGAGFEFFGREKPAEPDSGRAGQSTLSELLPPGVTLMTAGGPTSHNLLVAGTAEGVADLRGLLAMLDHRPQSLPVTVTVYPARPTEDAQWPETRATPETAVNCSVVLLAKGKGARPLAFPREAEPTAITLQVGNLTQEFIPLPAYRGFPQVLMSVTPRINADGTVTGTCAFGLLERTDRDGLEAAVRSARFTNAYTVNVSVGEEFAFLLSRPGGAVTAVVAFGKPGEGPK